MAVNETRSLNRDLNEGLTDGVVKKPAPDRGGEVELSDHAERLYLQEQYGYTFSDAADGRATARQRTV